MGFWIRLEWPDEAWGREEPEKSINGDGAASVVVIGSPERQRNGNFQNAKMMRLGFHLNSAGSGQMDW